jgi:hypothetical protein
MLFNRNNQKLKLADGVELGVECVLEASQDKDLEVRLPDGILAKFMTYIHIACVELVKKGEPQLATIAHDPKQKIFVVRDGIDEQIVAKIWYDHIPKKVAEKYAKDIKEACDTSVLNSRPPAVSNNNQ